MACTRPSRRSTGSAAHCSTLADSAVKQGFGDLGAEPAAQNRAMPGALRSHLKSEVGKWAPIMKEAGVYAD
jgi:tripartite-type tricarboxylate transporter receptor subunit TctC